MSMESQVKSEVGRENQKTAGTTGVAKINGIPKLKGKENENDEQTTTTSTSKRRCVSTACIACRRRKSKCDGNLPKCAACASVYLTECEYAPHTDHRRKGVYKKEGDSTKTKNTTLHLLIHALLNYEEDAAHDLLQQIRSCDNLEELAHAVEAREKGLEAETPDSPIYGDEVAPVPQFEAQLSGKMGDLVIDGSIRFIGGTSNLIWLNDHDVNSSTSPTLTTNGRLRSNEEAILRWTTVTRDRDEILHLMNLYFCWHYAYFTTLSKQLFYRDFLTGTESQYCSPLLVNVMLALGCHFSARPAARADPSDSSTTGDHFFAEAKRLLHENDEFAVPRLCTVQALALMSVREAGCGRESKGWVYSGMSFRMASDLGLNVDIEPIGQSTRLSDDEIDARSITYWGCFFFDKCWSNYLGRQPQLLLTNTNVKKPDVFGAEDSEIWLPYTDSGIINFHNQPARTRAIALEIVKLAEISSDLLTAFYQPQNLEKPVGKQAELKKLTDIHTRLEAWKKELPAELDPKDWQLPHVLLMHMFYQLLYIHLYRPFLKYTKATSPLPAHVSPRKFCTQAAGTISKLFRLYKRTHGLRQICNIAVYIAHSACTIHLLNLPDKNANRDIVHGIKHLEEIGECWTCARRTLRILELCAEKWQIDLPEETQATFLRARQRWGSSEASPAAMSPDVMGDLGQHTDPQPVSNTMARNFEMQRTFPQTVMSGESHAQHSVFDSEASASDLTPITAGSDVNKGSSQLRAMAELTKAQQEVWNAHQARMVGQKRLSHLATRNNQRNAAVLFGGVESLMEESQEWWLQDQSQLALGFDNWNSPTTEWSQGRSAMGPTSVANSNLTSPSEPLSYPDTDLTQNTFGAMSAIGQPVNGTGSSVSSQQVPYLQQHPDLDVDGIQAATMLSIKNSRKRTSTFQDGNVYY